jgi:hypothetical protein
MADGDDRVARLLVAAAVWLGSPRWWRGLLVGIQPPADAHQASGKELPGVLAELAPGRPR